MKIEPFLIASSLNLVMAQRLVRKICEYCRESLEISPEIEKQITDELKEIKDFSPEEYRDKKTGRLKFYHGKGCVRCSQEGYKGRTTIFEIIENTEQLKNVTTSGCKIDKLKEEMKRQSMVEMRKDGYIKALRGITTIEEVLRAASE
jgi:type II secretory ATPase GspE/PulE/Tfp pilus assembly ATPase PilB-like protein